MNLANKVALVSPDELIPYEKNARVHSTEQIKKIASSIEEFGFTNPILVDKANGVIAGHGRLAASKLLGLKRVPIIVLDYLTEKQKKALILSDNRIAEDARWDYDLLKSELASIEGFNLEVLGFTDTELENLLPDLSDMDAALGIDAPPKVKTTGEANFEEEREPDTEEIKKEVIGATEYSAEEFDKFEHKCPRCSFEFNK